MKKFGAEEGMRLAAAETRRPAPDGTALSGGATASDGRNADDRGLSQDGRSAADMASPPDGLTVPRDREDAGNRRELALHGVTVIREEPDGGLRVLLEDAHVRVAPGEWVNVAGVNGSGKSTLARLLAGLHCEGAQGRIERGFAGAGPAPVVLQRPEAQLFGATPREEVLLALEWRPHPSLEAERAAAEALREVGLEALADAPWERLSGGQRQLAAVAAAISGEAPLLVFDEATSRLDGQSRLKVMEIARRRHAAGAAVVWVTQRLEELRPDERVIALRDGRIRFDGSARAFFGLGHGGGEGPSPCERCGLRLPFSVALELGIRRGGSPADVSPTPSVTGETSLASGPAAMDGEKGIVVAGLLPDEPVRMAPGTVTLIAGPNGAGKTHLLEQLAGLRPPGDLDIFWDGQPLWASGGPIRRRRLRREALLRYGYAPQDAESQLFLGTFGEELRYALRPYRLVPGERDRRIGEALKAFGWKEADLARDPFRMSEGEKRRAALTAAMATPAAWLLLDEPTAGLDGEGQRALAAALARSKGEGRGIAVASHDWEWALPLADRLLILRGPGKPPVWCSRRDLLERPELLAEAGLRPPDWLLLAREAWKKGAPEPGLWDPAQLASHASTFGLSADGADCRDNPELSRETAGFDAKGGTGPGRPARWRETGTADSRLHGGARGLAAFDPRALLLAYGILATGLARLGEWRELLAGGVLVAALAMLGRIPVRRWRGLIIGWMLAALLMSAAAGLAEGGGDAAAALAQADRTLRVFTATLLAMLPGLGVLTAISPHGLKLSLERLGSFRGGTPDRVRWLALAATMTLRFVPLLLAEWERFGKLSLARGKAPRLSPGAFVRALRDQAVPFLLALFRLAEETAAALESRGAGRGRPGPSPVRLRWGIRDTALAAGAALAAAVLWWWTSG